MTVSPQTQTTYVWKDDQDGSTVTTTTNAPPTGWIHVAVQAAGVQHVFDLNPTNAAPFVAAVRAVLTAQQGS